MNYTQGCYGAASVFAHDSEICHRCQTFDGCADECLKTLDAIKRSVDVSDLLMRHETARKSSGLSNDEATDHPDCLGGKNVFAHDSDNCRDCQKYKACDAESQAHLGEIHDPEIVSVQLKRHDAARAKLRKVSAPIVSDELTAQLGPEYVEQSESTAKNAEAKRHLVSGSLNTPDVEHELIVVDATPSNDWTEDILLADDDEFATFFRKLTESPANSLPNNETVVLASADDKSDLSGTEDEALDSLEADVAVADVPALEFLSIIKVNEDAIPPRFRKGGGPAPFHVSGAYRSDETHALQQRQMDDLVYLSKQGRSSSVHKKYEGIFASDGKLNMALAGDFISEKAWTLEQKASKILKLKQFEQLQCCALASKKINDKWWNSLKHAAKVEVELNTIADKDEQFRKYVSEFSLLAQAIYLCRGLDAKNVRLVLGWLTGKGPISRQAIKAKIERLKMRLA